MASIKLIGLILIFRAFVVNTFNPQTNKLFDKNHHTYTIKTIGKLDTNLTEFSGLSFIESSSSFVSITDSGGPNSIILLNKTLDSLNSIPIEHKNYDWECISTDTKGNTYIGELGNNCHCRKDLKILILDKEKAVSQIKISYADQTNFPPPKGQRNFDCEAFFYYNDFIYLFSKNFERSPTKLYKVPAKAGSYILKPIASINLNANITGADISPNAEMFSLVSYGKVFFFEIKQEKISFKNPYKYKRFSRGGQAESIAYQQEDKLIIINENGRIFQVTNNTN